MKVIFVAVCLLACSFPISAAGALGLQSLDYDTLIQQGRAQLQAGNSDNALTLGEQAIKADPSRWEAYAVAGGALMNLHRYEEAADQLSEAITRAPESKQVGLRDLRKQSVLAETRVSSAPDPPTAPTPTLPASTSQAEIVLWKSIEHSAHSADFQGYMDQYPHGAFFALAQSRLAEARRSEQNEVDALQQQQKAAVWTDPNTGLMWTRNDNDADITAGRAAEFCSELRLLAFTNWRVPSYDELKKIQSRGHVIGEITISSGAGSLWTSTHAGLGGYYSGKSAISGYDIIPLKSKANGMRTLCVRN